MNEILLYTAITAETAANFIQNLNWIGEDQVYSARLYCPGGDVQAAWGMWAKMNELKAKGCHSIGKVDGMAASMGGYILCAFDEREALSVSSIMIHRAEMVEDEENPLTPEDLAQLAKINSDLKARLTAIVDDKKLLALKGISIDDLFSKKERINCWLTAQEAEQIGLVTKIIPIDGENSNTIAKAVASLYKAPAATAVNTNNKKMTKDEFKEKNPEAAKEMCKEAVEAYKAELKEKAKAAKAKAEDPDDDGDDDSDPVTDTDHDGGGKNAKKAKAEANVIAMAVEKVLAGMGIEKVAASATAQTATATAKASAEAEASKKTAQEEEIALTKQLIEATKKGDSKAIAEIQSKLYK